MDNVQTQVRQLSMLADKFGDLAANAAVKILIALLIYIAGRFLISRLLKIFDRIKSVEKIDTTARSYMRTFIKASLYIVLMVSIVAELGVPISSVVAVIASCGIALGLALQGALSNFAGGIMLLIFRPFNVGDYIKAGGEEGTVSSISPVYTVLKTVDNKMVSIPNGTMMNANIVNATSEEMRRVDLSFNISGEISVRKVRATIMGVIINVDKALASPAPEVQPVEGIPGGLRYAVRVWVRTADYFEVFNELMIEIPTALGAAEIPGPSTYVKVNDQTGNNR